MSQLLRFGQDMEELWSSLGEIRLVTFEMKGGLFRHDFDTDAAFHTALGRRLDVAEFADDRETAQKLANLQTPETPWSFQLPDIYRNLRAAPDEELALLEQTLEPIPQARRFIEYAVAHGARLVAACDGPFTKEFWQARLDRAGISGIGEILTSCEDGVSKQRYTMFRRILSESQIDPQFACHFGSDPYSDLGVPLDIGMKAMLVESVSIGLATSNPVFSAVRDAVAGIGHESGPLILRAIEGGILTGAEGRDESDNGLVREIGAAALGPVLVAFCQWLREWLIFHQCKKCIIVASDMSVFSRVSRILLQRMVAGLEVVILPPDRISEFALELRDIEPNEFAIINVDPTGDGAGRLIARNPLLSIRPILHFLLDRSSRNAMREPVFFHGNGFPEDRAKIARLAEPLLQMLFTNGAPLAMQALPAIGQFVIEWSKFERRYPGSRITRRQVAAILEAVTRLELQLTSG